MNIPPAARYPMQPEQADRKLTEVIAVGANRQAPGAAQNRGAIIW